MLEDSKNFLLVSESYINSLGKSEKEKNILSRRTVVIKHLNSEYKLVRNSFPKIMDELKSMNIIVTVHTVKKDIEIYRLAYKYYHGEKRDILKRLENQKDFVIKPLRYLIEDGFDSWKKVAKQLKDADAPITRGVKKNKKKPPIKKKELEMPTDVELKNGDVPDPVKGWLQKHFRQIQSFVTDLLETNEGAKSALEKSMATSVKKDEEIKKLKAEIASLRKNNLELSSQAKAQAEVFEHKLREGNQLLIIADTDIKKLKEETVFLRAEIKRIQKEKQDLLEISNLVELETEGARNHLDEIMSPEDIPVEIILPTKCVSFGKPFEYSEEFLETFNSLEKDEKALFVKKMELLSISGSRHQSFRSKVQNVNRGPLKKGKIRSHAGKFLRFIWEINEKAVCIEGLFHKKDLEG